MLKGKKSIYVLLPLNLLIWGYMAYKIYAALHEEEAPVTETLLPQPKVKPTDNTAYTLKLNYKDPFLKQEIKPGKRAYAAAIAPAQAPPAAKPKAPVLKDTAPAPDIKYIGMIENKTNGSMAAMVLVNGSSQIVKPGQALGDIQFHSFTQDYLTVKIGKEKLTIKK
jgi:hypothetical protein